jgi:hypothetical protein
VRQLSEVKRPDGSDGDKATAWINELTREKDQAIKPALTDLKKAAQTKDPAAIQRAVKRIQSVDEKKVDQLAQDAGARSCGS